MRKRWLVSRLESARLVGNLASHVPEDLARLIDATRCGARV
ncbi:hypothetical protein [Streptomyces sp. 35G-GA-8]|nr:hypothetical protein [Streptomyces sp. 35G-GA-8]